MKTLFARLQMFALFCLVLTVVPARAITINFITIHFIDKGEEVLTKTAPDNQGSVTLSSYFSADDSLYLKAKGDLQSFDGFEFEGWKTNEPMNHEREFGMIKPDNINIDTKEGILQTLTIGTEDITLFAVYRRTYDCYRRITQPLLDGDKKYLIVGNYQNNYYVMGKENDYINGTTANGNKITIKAAKSTSVVHHNITRDGVWHFGENNDGTLAENGTVDKIYEHTTTDQYVWKLTKDNNSGKWYLNNQGDESKWLRFDAYYEKKDYFIFVEYEFKRYEDIINQTSSPFSVTSPNNNEVFTLGVDESYTGRIRFLIFSWDKTVNHAMRLWFYNAEQKFLLGDESDDNDIKTNTKYKQGNIYLYKEAKEHHYLCHQIPYTVNFRAHGNATAGEQVSDFVLASDKLSMSQTRSNYITAEPWELCEFTGVTPPTASDITIGCSERWTFRGWVKGAPLEETTDDPSSLFMTNDSHYSGGKYNPVFNKEVWYAVYGHNGATAGTYDYYTSYPTCDPYTVYFDPCDGEMVWTNITNVATDGVKDESAKTLTQNTYTSNIKMPSAKFDGTCTGTWSFEGWATEKCDGVTSAPATLKAANAFYKPVTKDEHYYAVYKYGSYWTSYPTCEKATVVLDPGTGSVADGWGSTIPSDESEKKRQQTEVDIVSGITLPTAQHNCSVWTLAGWSETPVNLETNAMPADLIASGTLYHPKSNNVTLYAVYRRGSVYYSNPDTDCTGAIVTLHACAGDDCGDNTYMYEADGTKHYTKDIQETSAGTGVDFHAPQNNCSRWEFAGWRKGTPYTNGYTEPTGLIAADAHYEPSQNEEFYAVYKHIGRNYWTSAPDCSEYSVTLHACEGYFTTVSDNQMVMTDTGAGIDLPACTPNCGTRGWLFYGWIEGGELGATNSQPTVYKGKYYPLHDGVELYAVYSIERYDIVTSTADLNITSKYALVFYFNFGDNNMPYEWFRMGTDSYSYNGKTGRQIEGIYSYVDEYGIRYIDKPTDTDNQYIWSLEKTDNNWYIKNNNGSYLYNGDNDNLSLSTNKTAFSIDLNNHTLKKNGNNRYLHFTRNTNVNPPVYYAYVDNTPDDCYLYKEAGKYYASWAHCMAYSVMFDGCDGSLDFSNLTSDQKADYQVDETNLIMTEQKSGKGVVLPTVKDYCSGWSFAGWAESHIDEAVTTTELSQPIYPAGSVYIPSRNNVMLYAVYYQTQNKYQRVTNLTNIKCGVNTLIVSGNSGNYYAMGNTINNDNRIYTTNVTINNSQITSSTAALNWTLLYTDEDNSYFLYNNDSKKYLGTNNGGRLVFDDNPIKRWSVAGTDPFSFVTRNYNLYLYYSTNYRFDIKTTSSSTIQIYQQQATFRSYPCSQLVEAAMWDRNAAYVESITLSGEPTKVSEMITSIEAASDGMYKVNHKAAPGSRIRIKWGEQFFNMNVPYVATENYTPNVENFPTHTFVVASGEYLINKTTNLHKVYVYSGATLTIAANTILNVDTLVISCTGDQSLPVINIAEGGQINVKSGVIYNDRRIGYDRYYTVAFPLETSLADLRYSGLISDQPLPVPLYREDYWLKYYDGKKRSEDATAVAAGTKQEMATTYWTHVDGTKGVAGSYTAPAGKGYMLCIRDPKAGEEGHKRTLRFKMEADAAGEWYSYENGANTKIIQIDPSKVDVASDKYAENIRHSGWNYVGNPYLHNYYPGTPAAGCGLVSGYMEMDATGKWKIAGDNASVPYLTYYNQEEDTYYQTQVANSVIRPFSPVFIQVEEHEYLEFGNPVSTSSEGPANPAPRHLLAKSYNTKVNTGLALANSDMTEYDQTGVVISDKYTADNYEIGGDLMKMKNSGKLNVYSLMQNGTELAFNAMNEQQAQNNIPLGIVIPQAGRYVFSFDSWQYDPTQVRQLLLTDYELGKTVDLLMRDYEFNERKGVNNTRFAVAVVPNEEPVVATPTVADEQSMNSPFCFATIDGLTVSNLQEATDIRVFDLLGRQIYSADGVSGKQHLSLPTGVYNIVLTTGTEQTTLRGIVK